MLWSLWKEERIEETCGGEWVGKWGDSMKESCIERDLPDCYWEKQDPIQEHGKTSKECVWESYNEGDWTAIRGIGKISNSILKLIRTGGNDVEGGRCMRGSGWESYLGGRWRLQDETYRDNYLGGDEGGKMKPTKTITWGEMQAARRNQQRWLPGERWRLQDDTNKDGWNLTVKITDSVRVCWIGMNGRAVEDEYENTNR